MIITNILRSLSSSSHTPADFLFTVKESPSLISCFFTPAVFNTVIVLWTYSCGGRCTKNTAVLIQNREKKAGVKLEPLSL